MSKQINEFEKLAPKIAAENLDPKNIWARIEDFLYRKDKDGNWIRNENGKRALAWERILLKMYVLIGLLVERISQHESAQESNARGGELTEIKVGTEDVPVTTKNPTPVQTSTATEIRRSLDEPAPEPQQKKKKGNSNETPNV